MKYRENHTVYTDKSGIEVPSATTILSILNKPAVNNWANYLGFRKINYEKELNRLAEFGTQVHKCVECIMKDETYTFDNSLGIDKYEFKTAIGNFLEWKETNDISPIMMESRWVSENYHFGGTVDFYGVVNGLKTIVDYKTSKQIRLTMFIQLAMYTILLEENEQQVDQVGIVLVNRNAPENKFISRSELDPYIKFAKNLIGLFHEYYILNDNGWKEKII